MPDMLMCTLMCWHSLICQHPLRYAKAPRYAKASCYAKVLHGNPKKDNSYFWNSPAKLTYRSSSHGQMLCLRWLKTRSPACPEITGIPYLFICGVTYEKTYLSWIVALNVYFYENYHLEVYFFKIKGITSCVITCKWWCGALVWHLIATTSDALHCNVLQSLHSHLIAITSLAPHYDYLICTSSQLLDLQLIAIARSATNRDRSICKSWQ